MCSLAGRKSKEITGVTLLSVFLAEFMDQRWLPASLHATLRDVLGFHLRVTLGYYYEWAAKKALARAWQLGTLQVAEIGAGSAGFSEYLAARVRDLGDKTRVQISDLHPQPERYRALERQFPGILTATTTPVDFIERQADFGNALVVMSAAFHHIPYAERPRMLAAMASRRVMVFESVTRNVPSMLGCAIGFLPAMLTPLFFLGTQDGRWRRFLWCWLIPIAPLMVAWDGVVSCLRCWTEDEWRQELARRGVPASEITIERRRFSHMISW